MITTASRLQASPRQMLTWTSAGSLVTAVAAALTAGLIVSRAVATTYGDFGVLVAVGLLLANGLRLGADKMVASEVRRSLGPDGQQCGQDLLAVSALAALAGFVVLVIAPFDYVLNLAVATPLSTTEMALFGALVSADVFRLTAAEALRAQLRAALASITGNAGRAMMFGGALLVADLADVVFDRTLLLACAAAASAITAAASATVARRHYRITAGHPITRLRRQWRGHSAMVAATLSATIIGSADIWLVGGLVGSEAAARYALAVSATALVGILLTASHVAVQPYLAEMVGRGARQESQRLSARMAILGSWAGGVGLLFIVVAAEPLAVAAGGDAYRGLRVLCIVLGLGVFSGLIIGPAGVGLIAVGRYAVMGRLAVATAALALIAECSVGIITRSEVPIAFCSALAVTVLHGSAWRQLVHHEGFRTDAFADRSQKAAP